MALKICLPAAGWVMLGVLCVGCSNERQAAREALPKTYPASVNDWNGKVDHVDFLSGFDLSHFSKVVVAPVDTSQVQLPPKDDNTYDPTVNALARATQYIADGIRGKLNGIIPVEPQTSAATEPGNVLVVHVKITELNPGSQAARYWVGFGAGASRSSLQGDIVDNAGGQTLVRFQNAKNRSMGSFGGSYTELLADQLTTAGQDIGVLLSAFAPPGK